MSENIIQRSLTMKADFIIDNMPKNANPTYAV